MKGGKGKAEPYRNIDERDARSVIRVWLELVDKRVLAPIADHQAQSQQDEWYHEHEDGRPRVDVAGHEGDKRIVGHFGTEGA